MFLLNFLLLAAALMTAVTYCDAFSTTSLRNSFGKRQSSIVLSAADVPFFATQMVNGEGLKEGKASITTRLPLGKIFDSRDYIFSTASNVRGYEWTTKETEELFDDLCDGAQGLLGTLQGSGATDYELSQIVLIPMSWDREKFGLGSRYDVHDGQQRWFHERLWPDEQWQQHDEWL